MQSACVDITHIEQSCIKHLESQIEELATELKLNFAKMPSDDVNLYVRIHCIHDNMRSFVEFIEQDQLRGRARTLMADVEGAFGNACVNIIKTVQDEVMSDAVDVSYDEVADTLIDIKLMAVHIASYRSHANKAIDDLLNKFKRTKDGPKKIGTLSVELNSRCSNGGKGGEGLSQMIIAEHSAFQG